MDGLLLFIFAYKELTEEPQRRSIESEFNDASLHFDVATGFSKRKKYFKRTKISGESRSNLIFLLFSDIAKT